MSDRTNKVIKMISAMEIGSTFTSGDMAIQIFDGDVDIIRARSGFVNRYIRFFINSGSLVVETIEEIGKRKRYVYKKVKDIFIKEVVVEWTEGFPDDWVATTYINGEIVSKKKDW